MKARVAALVVAAGLLLALMAWLRRRSAPPTSSTVPEAPAARAEPAPLPAPSPRVVVGTPGMAPREALATREKESRDPIVPREIMVESRPSERPGQPPVTTEPLTPRVIEIPAGESSRRGVGTAEPLVPRVIEETSLPSKR